MPGHYDPATIRSQLVRSDGRLPDPHFRTRLPSVSITRSHSGPRTSFWDPQLRGELQGIDDPSAGRLAAQIDVAATMLLAVRRYMQACGQFALPVTSDRCSSTFRESWSTCRATASP